MKVVMTIDNPIILKYAPPKKKKRKKDKISDFYNIRTLPFFIYLTVPHYSFISVVA